MTSSTYLPDGTLMAMGTSTVAAQQADPLLVVQLHLSLSIQVQRGWSG